jgi:hypothetical protein
MGLWGYYLYLFSKVIVPEILSGVAGLLGGVKSLFVALRAKLYFRGCVKRFFTALRAKYKFETTLDSLILRSKINESSVVSI